MTREALPEFLHLLTQPAKGEPLMAEAMTERAELNEAHDAWAGDDESRKKIADAMFMVLVDVEVMLPQIKDRKDYRKMVVESVGDLGDALMAAWDRKHGQ